MPFTVLINTILLLLQAKKINQGQANMEIGPHAAFKWKFHWLSKSYA